MSELEVRIERLEPLRVVSFSGYGESPEPEALAALQAWAKPKGLLDDPAAYTLFGFNNPDPSPGTPNYGYEVWLVIDPDMEPEGDVEVKEFSGGLYAVTECKGVENIGPTWKQFVAWREASKYQHAHHQWLEKHLTTTDIPLEEFRLALYMPVEEGHVGGSGGGKPGGTLLW